MKRVITQIYEIQEPIEADQMIELGVDHIGSVLLREDSWKDPRILEVMEATRGTRTLNNLIPLFNRPDAIFAAIDHYAPHIVHFCEALVDSRGQKVGYDRLLKLQRSLRERYPHIKTMRSVPVVEAKNSTDIPLFDIGKDFCSVSDFFLLDTWVGNEPVAGFIGITGRVCDWDIAADFVKGSKIPVILAGGLSPENVREAILKVRPFGVDSCMQTNHLDAVGKPIRFKKDIRKVEKFIGEVRLTQFS